MPEAQQSTDANTVPPDGARTRVRASVRGAVQGVGFRPFVFRLAEELGLDGWVLNDVDGVELEVEGTGASLRRFLRRLDRECPPRAVVQERDHRWLPARGLEGFEIRHSDAIGTRRVIVLPDVATCDACLAEVLDPGNRRHGYPFTNCTDCGPRFSIVRDLPYDRPNTTMADFALCATCADEYEDPTDRRFHAQPNACPDCGPSLELRSGDSRLAGPKALTAAVDSLRSGDILALKGLGGYLLLVDATSADAVGRLRRRKRRPTKPLAVMAADLDAARELVRVDEAAATLLTSPEAPIVLLDRARDSVLAASVAPDNPRVGVMLPTTPLHHLLARRFEGPLVATSGNVSDEPICITDEEARRRLASIADTFLLHDRPIARHVDDSVVQQVGGGPQVLRRARGLAPLPVRLSRSAPTILAVGGHLKNTVALTIGRQAFLSQHIGDMETPESREAFERVIEDFLRLYDAEPAAIAHDLHPDYASSRWARSVADGDVSIAGLRPGLPLIPVQHHHAHLASMLAEARHDGSALGVTWDGTGLGPDATIWGGELMVGSAAGYRRVASLRPFQLPGGDAAVREPRRTALALLWEVGDGSLDGFEHTHPVRSLEASSRVLLEAMLAGGINAPTTTSAGRLFDGVASLAGVGQVASYEGEAAMALEYATDLEETGAYPLPLVPADPTCPRLDWRPMVRAVVEDVERGTPVGRIAARFHRGLVDGIVAVAQTVGEETVCLTGGCFQNRILTELTTDRLRKSGFRILLHRQVPANDGGLSLGQVAVAAAHLSGLTDTAGAGETGR